MAEKILVLNAGSSSIKFQIFEIDENDQPVRHMKGQINGIGTHPHFYAKTGDDKVLIDESWPVVAVSNVPAALDRVMTWLQQQFGGSLPMAVGHRVAHGGLYYGQPTIIDDAVLERLEHLTSLAPLHQPSNLAPIRAIRAKRPELLQVACFDTAFHSGRAEVAQRYAIPDELHREGVRRYGFHGLSYEYIARELSRKVPVLAQQRVIVAHLGSGASMCAMKAGRSIDSTMGFTALDGLPMGTRSGQIDPGVLLYLLYEKKWDAARLQEFLYQECGLKGMSGISSDMRDLLDSQEPMARVAVDYFIYRILRETGSLAAAMGGIDGFVFTGGIGENAQAIRSRVCRGLSWLGMKFDDMANAQNNSCISMIDSRISAWVIPTDEEFMIAEHTRKTVAGIAQRKVS